MKLGVFSKMIPVCVADFEQHAKNVLSKSVFEYYFGGADEERTLKRNTKAFERLLNFLTRKLQ